jgi:hypothetical protein
MDGCRNREDHEGTGSEGGKQNLELHAVWLDEVLGIGRSKRVVAHVTPEFRVTNVVLVDRCVVIKYPRRHRATYMSATLSYLLAFFAYSPFFVLPQLFKCLDCAMIGGVFQAESLEYTA